MSTDVVFDSFPYTFLKAIFAFIFFCGNPAWGDPRLLDELEELESGEWRVLGGFNNAGAPGRQCSRHL